MSKIVFSGLNEAEIKQWAENFRDHLGILLKEQLSKEKFVLNPVLPCGHAKIKDRFRFQFIIRTNSIKFLNQCIEITKFKLNSPKDGKLLIDINPLTIYF